MDIKEAKQYIQAGFAFGNWTKEQKEAFEVAWNCLNNKEIEKATTDDLISKLNVDYVLHLTNETGSWILKLEDEFGTSMYTDSNENLKELLINAVKWQNRNLIG